MSALDPETPDQVHRRKVAGRAADALMEHERALAVAQTIAANGRALVLGTAICAAILGLNGAMALALIALGIAWAVDQLGAGKLRTIVALVSYSFAGLALASVLFNLG